MQSSNHSNYTHSNPIMDFTIDSIIIDVPSISPLHLEDLAVSQSNSPIVVANWVSYPYLKEDLYSIL